MDKNITYHWGDDHLRIALGNRIQPRIRILFWAEFVFTLSFAGVFFIRSLPLPLQPVSWLTFAGSGVLVLLASYRLLSRIFVKEELLLTHHALIIIQRGLFRRQSRIYNWADIGTLHYVGKENKTDHPLKSRSFDYFGFETHEHLIQSLHHEGNLYFNYIGYAVRFARNVYSWDAEEMVYMMKIFAGASLRLGPEWEEMLREHEMGDANNQ